MQTIGNVTDDMPSYKIINGNSIDDVTSLQQAIRKSCKAACRFP